MEQAKKEIIFICYEDVIKTVKPYILMKLAEPEYRENYEEFIDYSRYIDKEYIDLLRLCSGSLHENILDSLKIKEFDTEASYKDLYYKFDDIFEKSPSLIIGQNLFILLKQKFVEKIYIYSKEYDERIRNDVSKVYQETDKMEYLSGDFKECVKSIPEKITSYILNDVTLINDLIEIDKVSNTQILILDAGYNFILTDDNEFVIKIPNLSEISIKNNFKTGWFKQFQIKEQ